VVREPIPFAEDAENMHFTFKREYVLPVDLGIQKKSESLNGLKTGYKIINFLVF
jgi:hypothetical protein